MNLSRSVTVDKIAVSSALIVVIVVLPMVVGLIDDALVVNIDGIVTSGASSVIAAVVGTVAIAASIAEVGVVNIATLVVG